MIAPSPNRLNPKRRQKYSKSKLVADVQQRFVNRRINFIQNIYPKGGASFLEVVRKYGCNEKGEDLIISPWFEEFLLLIGNLKIHEIYTIGHAQSGKTLAHNLLLCYALTVGGLNVLWVYDQERTLNRNVPLQFRPMIAAWLQKMGISSNSSGGTQKNSLYQFEKASVIFGYVSTSRVTATRQGLSAAGSSVVSVTADMLIADERSQFPPGTAAPLPRRLDASSLSSKPQRDLGTPGSGNGVEMEVKKCSHHFYPHFICDECHQEQPLDPKGCLFKGTKKKSSTGEEVTTFFSETGRPVIWWHSDPKDPIGSSYFACAFCGHAIRDEQRKNAHFKCLNTAVHLKSFLAELDET